MADTIPANVTPTTPAPAPAAAPAGAGLGQVRTGFATLVAAVGLFLLGLAAFYFVNATWLGATEGPTADSWAAGFKHREVWPIAIWSLVFGLAAAAFAYLLFTGQGRADRDTPAWLSRMIAFTLFAGTLALLCLPIYLLVRARQLDLSMRTAITPMFIWAALALAVLAIGGALALMEDSRRDEGRLRMLLLGLGLSLGALTFVLGLALATITFWVDFGKGLESWRERPIVLLWPVAAYVAGLALAFFGTQPATPLVHTDQNIRRTVFGANLAVTVGLLIGVLALPNVLAWAEPFTRFFGRSYDWTATGFHALSDRTRNYLAGHREPVKVYVLLPSGHPITKDVIAMLDNCRSLNSNISYELIDTTSRATADRRREFMSKYNLTDPSGLLLVSGTAEKGNFSFVKVRDLFDEGGQRGRRGGGPSYSFKGEGALLNALLALAEGEVKIYFTTGHGELSLDAGMPKMPGQMPRGGGELTTLRMRLTDRESVKVEPLTIDTKTKEIPKDASVVVIARPRQPFSKEEAKVLRDYLRRDRKTRKEKLKDKGDIEREVEEVTAGKLFILLDPVYQKEGRKSTMVPTGLEELFKDYGVKVGDGRILAARRPNPEDVLAIADQDSANPIAQAFNRGDRTTLFSFNKARTVEPVAAERRGRGSAEPLLLVPSIQGIRQFVWEEKDLDASAQVLRDSVVRDEDRLEKTISMRPLSLAVTVADQGAPPGMPRDAAHAPALHDTPRMVVIGSASWITDEGLAGEQSPNRIALFTSCVTWLNAKSAAVGPSEEENKQRQLYTPNVSPDNQSRLYLLPLVLMLAAVMVVGMGVWVVRRR